MAETYFHVTPRRNLAAILTEGLRTDADGWDSVYVWVFSDEATALSLADNGCWGGVRGPHPVLAVDLTGLDVIPDPHPGWGDSRDDHAFAVAGDVPPDRIEVHRE